jgi:hypothetical protein
MAELWKGRWTAELEGSFVVFVIGMRINRLLALNKWLPVVRAMPAMLEELKRQPELGLLGAETFVTWRGLNTLQYWRSFEHLHAYAHARDKAHLPAWAAFNRAVGSDGSVGIYHETYEVQAGRYECVHANMPRWGLTRVGAHMEAVGRRNSARERMRAE